MKHFTTFKKKIQKNFEICFPGNIESVRLDHQNIELRTALLVIFLCFFLSLFLKLSAVTDILYKQPVTIPLIFSVSYQCLLLLMRNEMSCKLGVQSHLMWHLKSLRLAHSVCMCFVRFLEQICPKQCLTDCLLY